MRESDPQEPERRNFLDLSARQQAAVATALTIVAASVIIVAALGGGWLISIFLRKFSHVFLPLAVGAVAALVFNPYYTLLCTKLRLPGPVAVVFVFLSILIPLTAFGWFFGAIAVDQIGDMVDRFPKWWGETVDTVKEKMPRVRSFFEENPWGRRIRNAAEAQQGALVEGLQRAGIRTLGAGGAILAGIGHLAAWAVLPVYFVFFLMTDTKRKLEFQHLLPFLKEETREDVVYLVREFVNIIVAFFRGQLIVAFLQGLLFAVGFSIVGLRYGFILGLLLGLLNIIPYLGSIIGLSVCIPLAYFQPGGGWLTIVWVLAVFTLVQLIEAYLLTPKIMGDRTGLHPMAIIVAIFFWGAALQGILGMILAIPLTAFLVVFWRLAREKYIGEAL